MAYGINHNLKHENLWQNLDFKIWKMAIEIADELFVIADKLKHLKLFRFADQLSGSGMSMPNNIAEGSGSSSNNVFNRYLDIARSSTFKNANIVIRLARKKIVNEKQKNELLENIDHLCRKITNFQKSLKR